MMMTKLHRYRILTLALVGLACAGCLVSGTFVIVEDVAFDFTADTGYYWYPVDLAGNSDWEDHKDDIDDIDALGFDFLITNNSSQTCALSVMFQATTGTADPNNPPPGLDPANFTLVIDGLVVPAGQTKHVTYTESQGLIQNLEALKAIVKTGRFDYLGFSCGGTGDDLFQVTEGKIIVTVSASNT